MAGLPRIGPRIQIPLPTHIKNARVNINTTNNIRVQPGSQVGQINAGALVYLNRAVTNFNSMGNRKFAAALQDFTQGVVDSKELPPESQRQVLDLLQALVEQTAKPKEQRNGSKAKLVFQNMSGLVSAATFLSAHWERSSISSST